MNKAIKLIIRGRVQGVGYRRWFEQQALALALTGYVKNLDSGEVEAVIVGHFDVLQELISRSYDGPPRAEVVQVFQIILAHEQNFVGFNMLR
ncbi:acylphosphatase [Acinetobacter kyonggiensis]|uniref:acylphosphatase n=1 Tax=Acinetobacter kyonggiensis TaxID=595670 RepID=A0A1H3H3T0_9GAMM|nr:acylphosphatase [Acinetobacter kyonggiensis]SDY10166.1 acylphosphatase [Acinetobacter kyonggiensis]